MSRATEDHVVKPKEGGALQARLSTKFLLNVQGLRSGRGQDGSQAARTRLVDCWRPATSKRKRISRTKKAAREIVQGHR